MKISVFALILSLVLFAGSPVTTSAEEGFATPTIDIGVVVSDLDAAAKFYTEAVGFKEVQGFTVDAEFSTDSGLTRNKKLDIRVFVLGEGAGATKLKLMQVPGVESKKADNQFIHSQLGFSYLTVMVKSTDATLARLKKAGVKPIAKGPVTLPSNLDPSLSLTIVKDPDGNFVELVGPKPTK
ncbi:MAG: VOC family protein [Verrucomicrobiota bacterium]